MIFARYEGTIEIGKELKAAKVSTAVNEEMPFLSFLGIFHNIGVIENALECFTSSLYLDNSDVESEVLLVVDELDCRLHPKLLRYIINLFVDPSINKNGAQLIFTSHDLSTMKGSIFRRDEIFEKLARYLD